MMKKVMKPIIFQTKTYSTSYHFPMIYTKAKIEYYPLYLYYEYIEFIYTVYIYLYTCLFQNKEKKKKIIKCPRVNKSVF